MKTPKNGRRTEEKTVYLLRCGDRYALQKRPDKGLLAGLWQLPETTGMLNVSEAVVALALPVKEIYRQLDKNHIFTHIEWKMRCFYLEITEKTADFQWYTAEEIQNSTALPTAYRQFWDAREDF